MPPFVTTIQESDSDVKCALTSKTHEDCGGLDRKDAMPWTGREEALDRLYSLHTCWWKRFSSVVLWFVVELNPILLHGSHQQLLPTTG